MTKRGESDLFGKGKLLPTISKRKTKAQEKVIPKTS